MSAHILGVTFKPTIISSSCELPQINGFMMAFRKGPHAMRVVREWQRYASVITLSAAVRVQFAGFASTYFLQPLPSKLGAHETVRA